MAFRTLAAALVIAVFTAGAASALEGVTVTPLARKAETASGQPIVLPRENVEVVVSVFQIAPGASLPVHKHPFARYALVEAGTLEVTNVETEVTTVYGAGDFVVEMIDQWHRARNAGQDAVRLIVIDQVEGGVENTLLGRPD